jgi:hypothetical protein
MSFEVQEIAIRMHVSGDNSRHDRNGGAESPHSTRERIDREALLRECVRLVLQALKDSQER